MPALQLAGIRQLIGGLYVWLLSDEKKNTRKQWKTIII
jgi:hypothetical protein